MKPDMIVSVLRKLLPRIASNHKGSMGRIGVVGGSEDFAGAPYFASMSALKLGADLSYVICSSSAGAAIKNYSPDLVVMPFLDADEESFQRKMELIVKSLHAVVIGPGLGREALTQKRAICIINEAKRLNLPLVVDADGLQIINNDASILANYGKVILTPNRMEFIRLLNKYMNDGNDSSSSSPQTHYSDKLDLKLLMELAKECSKKIKIPILVKGSTDIIVEPESNETFTTDSHVGSDRRCGGQGDILAGLTAVFMHWVHKNTEIQNSTSWAAYFAASVVKLTNQLTHERKGSSFLCSDMINEVSEAFELYKKNAETRRPTFKNVLVEYEGALTCEEIMRYQRQMLVGQIGLEGQLNLKNASVLIVGAGGLGCPSSIYLAAAGIGKIGIVDHDLVETSNLHRQILHTVENVGKPKVESIRLAIKAINPLVEVQTYQERFCNTNAVDITKNYDIVIDASDNLPTRHLINDACVFLKKPLVSGGALRTDGQLSVYNFDENTPCFRCVFPDPINPAAAGSCSEQGVIGVVPGLIGVLQAFEALKIASGMKPSYAQKLLFYSGVVGEFRVAKLAPRKQNCASCGSNANLTKELNHHTSVESDKATKCDTIEAKSYDQISLEDYRTKLNNKIEHLVIDVRPEAMFRASHFKDAINIPLNYMMSNKEVVKQMIERQQHKDIVVVCRRGISSQKAAQILRELLDSEYKIIDLAGGMTDWAKIDPTYACI